MILTFTIPGSPVAKRRHRTVPMSRCQSCNKITMGNYHECKYCGGPLRFVSNTAYSDSETVQYENLVAYCASQAMKEAGLTERFGASGRAVALDCKFYFLIPESRKCVRHKEGCKKLHDGDWHAQRPDADNCCKALVDGLLKSCYADDSIVAEMVLHKYWSKEPRTEVRVSEL